MVNAHTKYQKSLIVPRFRPGLKAIQEIRKYKKDCERLIWKVPYKNYLREIACDLKVGCDGDSKAVSVLHEASQAYLAGLFGNGHIQNHVAKRESTSFYLSLAWIGLKKLITVMTRDQELTKRICEKDYDSHHHHHAHHDHHEHHHAEEDDEEPRVPHAIS